MFSLFGFYLMHTLFTSVLYVTVIIVSSILSLQIVTFLYTYPNFIFLFITLSCFLCLWFLCPKLWWLNCFLPTFHFHFKKSFIIIGITIQILQYNDIWHYLYWLCPGKNKELKSYVHSNSWYLKYWYFYHL